ncbi:hypothetical protein JAAARDRAFT_659664 [Jaapia argillacea MUCL 33604]|uniref:Uncharacterized protein n=1 Tax=Jaapia argillacea MUCL 33604 TaxID=933084 RepID=A0A067Q9R9_9AGAM|nr:hypothetical protein JAAARDRAFT_659664 [Jaapia argillacea MUCL 33604]
MRIRSNCEEGTVNHHAIYINNSFVPPSRPVIPLFKYTFILTTMSQLFTPAINPTHAIAAHSKRCRILCLPLLACVVAYSFSHLTTTTTAQRPMDYDGINLYQDTSFEGESEGRPPSPTSSNGSLSPTTSEISDFEDVGENNPSSSLAGML